MSDTELIQELQGIGLSEKEARVYLAVLELGQDTVQHISEKAEVNRATTYVILESLATKGLVTTIGDEKKTVYVAEGPHSLNNIIHEQEEELQKKNDELEHILPELNTLYNLHPEKPVVRFYEGKEGLKEMLKERQEDEPDEVHVFYPTEQVLSLFSQEERATLKKRRIHRKIKNHMILSSPWPGELSGGELVDLSLVPEWARFTSNIEIWNDKVLIASLSGQISGVIIQSEQMARTLVSIFQLAKQTCKKYV